MKKLLLLLVTTCTFAFISAHERIYFDSSWAETTKDNAVYYRETSKEGNLTQIKDYYKNGTLQMEGLASDCKTLTKNKYPAAYAPQNNSKTDIYQCAQFQNGILRECGYRTSGNA